MRSAFAPGAVACVAVIAALVRWLLQGSRNFYTAIARKCYIADPDVEWALSDRHPIWLGLEVIGVLAGVAAALLVGGWIIRRRERKLGRPAKLLRAAAWAGAVAPWIVPIAAFATGFGDADCYSTRPESRARTVDTPGPATPDAPAITGSLDLPAGTYVAVVHKASAIAVKVSAGGDTFDARFADDLKGEWRGDPKDLTKPMTAEVSVPAAVVDTGIEARSNHAREGYLHADKFPTLGWKLDRLIAARADGPDRVTFRAASTVSLMGKTHAVEVTGSLKKADAAALGRLGLTGAVMIADADFSLLIKDTALAPDASTFGNDRFPIHVSLVLRHTGGN